MNLPSRFVVSTTFHGNRHTRTWNPKNPLLVGKTEEGPVWVIEQIPSGEIRVRSIGIEEGEVNNAHSQILTAEQIKKGVEFKIKKKKEEISLEIKKIAQLHPVEYKGNSKDLSKGFSVYEVTGNYDVKFASCSNGKFLRKIGNTVAFKVDVRNQQAVITVNRPDLEAEIDGKTKRLIEGYEWSLNADDFFKVTLKLGSKIWYFADFSEEKRTPLFDKPEIAQDAAQFKKYIVSAMIAAFLMVGGASLWPKSNVEEEVQAPPQVVKVLVQKIKKEKEKKGKKIEVPGEKKEQQEKALATSEKIEPVKKDQLIIPKGSAGRKTAKKPNVNVSKAQNLYAGIMKGGLTKILNNNQIENNAKLGQGVKMNGDLSNLSAAMSNLNVNLNAGGNTDSKVTGFGGSSNAGAKGPAAIGYSDGVRGVVMSGTGGHKYVLGDTEADVEEGLTKEEVGKVIYAHIKEIRYCYESSMVRADQVNGKVVLDFTINAKGHVAKVSDRRPAGANIDPQLGSCIMRRLRTWKFPNPKGGVTVDVSYPFIFKTLGAR